MGTELSEARKVRLRLRAATELDVLVMRFESAHVPITLCVELKKHFPRMRELAVSFTLSTRTPANCKTNLNARYKVETAEFEFVERSIR